VLENLGILRERMRSRPSSGNHVFEGWRITMAERGKARRTVMG
jgi:hypothetical protein